MTTGPQGREGGLEAQAEAALRALRAAEEMPPDAQARVWGRLAASTRDARPWPKEHVPRSRSTWAWGALALAAAAALLLASRAGVLGPLVATRDPGEAAAYTERGGAAASEPVRASGGEAGGADEPVVKDMSDRAGESRGESSPPQADPSPAGRAAKSEAKPRPRAETSGGAPAEAKSSRAAEATADAAEASTRSLAQEAEALARAQAAIQGGRADEALRVLSDYAQQFPRGALREEHDALRALALCASDRASEGRAAAQVFLGAHGGSALAERVRQGCPAE